MDNERMEKIKPPRLRLGDTIGLLAPSYAIRPEHVAGAINTLTLLGFQVKLSRNIYSEATGFSGTVQERAEDFNTMIADPDVQMMLFGGGEVCNEILPYIDYESVLHHPKILCSYSDSTTLLNAIHSRCGLVTFYGASPRTFTTLTDYNRRSFESRLMTTQTIYEKGSTWRALCPGSATGTLIGGYLVNFAAMMGGRYFGMNSNENHLLFMEDHEQFSSPAVVSKWFSHLMQSGLFDHVTGLIWGHYARTAQPLIDALLRRIGTRYDIPVLCHEDFGHGENNSIFPIGVKASLDAANASFTLDESGVL